MKFTKYLDADNKYNLLGLGLTSLGVPLFFNTVVNATQALVTNVLTFLGF